LEDLFLPHRKHTPSRF